MCHQTNYMYISSSMPNYLNKTSVTNDLFLLEVCKLQLKGRSHTAFFDRNEQLHDNPIYRLLHFRPLGKVIRNHDN